MFNQAMMIRVDELTSERHLHASFIEFLEALIRVIERASLSDINNIENSNVLSVEERKNLPLHVKIENSISKLMSLCT